MHAGGRLLHVPFIVWTLHTASPYLPVVQLAFIEGERHRGKPREALGAQPGLERVE